MTQVQAPPPRERTRRKIPWKLIIAVLIVGVLVGGYFGVRAIINAHDASVVAAANTAAGNQALSDARQDINTLNTMDYRNFNTDFPAWLNATTGTLYGRLKAAQAGLQTEFQSSQFTTSGTITDLKVAGANAAAGTASILGTETVNVSEAGQQTVRHNGFRADLIRTAVGWRLNDFNTTQLGN